MAERWKYILEFGEQRFELEDQPASVGRSRKCEISIADPSVSRRHAVLTAQEGSILLEDLGSSNGTFVNGERIQGSLHLHNGDTLGLGDAEIRVIVIAAAGLETVRLPAGDVPGDVPAAEGLGEATSFLQAASVRLAREALGESGDESLPSAMDHMAPPRPPAAPPPEPAAAPPAPAPASPVPGARSENPPEPSDPLQTVLFDPASLPAAEPENPLQTARFDPGMLPTAGPENPPLQATPADPASVPAAEENFFQTARFDSVEMGLPDPQAPPATEPPATEPPATEPPATERPATEPPATEPPATEPPVAEPSATEPPATEPPVAAPSLPERPVIEPALPEIAPALPAAPSAELPAVSPSGLGTMPADVSSLEASPSSAGAAASLDAPVPETLTFETPTFETPTFEPPAPGEETPSFEVPPVEPLSFEAPEIESPSFEAPSSFAASLASPESPSQPAPPPASPAVVPPTPEAPAAQPATPEGFGFEAPFAGSSMTEQPSSTEPPPAFDEAPEPPPASSGRRLSEIPSLEVPVPDSAVPDIRDLAAHQASGDLGFGGDDMLSSLDGFDTTLGPGVELPESMQRAQEHMDQLRHQEVATPGPVNPYVPAPSTSGPIPGSLVLRALAFLLDGLWMWGLSFGFMLFATGPIKALPAVFSLLVVLVGWSVWGSTPGKRLCGLVITNADGKPGIGLPRAVVRLVGYGVSTMLLGLGFLMALGSSRRALHDVLAGSQVVKR